MQKIASENNININIHPASEVFFQFNLTDILDNPITTFGNGKYMLIEFQRLSFPKGYEDEIFKLQLKKITPIIAHPERYRGIQKDINLAKKWIERGYLIQIDCASIIGKFGKETQMTAVKLLKSGLCHLIGSDAHNDGRRNFCLGTALEHVTVLTDESFSGLLIQNAHKVLKGEYIEEGLITIGFKKENLLSKLKSKIWRRIDI